MVPMPTRFLIAPLLLGYMLAAPGAYAADAPPEKPGAAFCQQNPQKCEEMRAKRDAFCKNNPQTCEAGKDRRDARRAYCEENPEKCKALREEHAQRREKMKAYCEESPQGREIGRASRRERV